MEPVSESDWTIHSINIQGHFFESWCEKTIRDNSNWLIRSIHEAVEFPPPQGPVRGKESHLDIRAERQAYEGILTLIVECKKANPEFVNWIFFPKRSQSPTNALVFSEIVIEDTPAESTGWRPSFSLKRECPFKNVPLTYDARETRGTYSGYKQKDKTRTANAAIMDAAYQVALGIQSVLYHQFETLQVMYRIPSVKRGTMAWSRQILLPIIVTTASIHTCDVDPKDVSPQTGEITSYDKAQLNQHDYLLFEYSLPRHLQLLPEYFDGDQRNRLMAELIFQMQRGSAKYRTDMTRMHIVVVNSNYFPTFLADFDVIALKLMNALS